MHLPKHSNGVNLCQVEIAGVTVTFLHKAIHKSDNISYPGSSSLFQVMLIYFT
jgi:hypothetical protein